MTIIAGWFRRTRFTARLRPLSVDSLLRDVRRATQSTPTALTIRAGADAPIEVGLGRDRRVFVNAYTDALLGEGSPKMRGFFVL